MRHRSFEDDGDAPTFHDDVLHADEPLQVVRARFVEGLDELRAENDVVGQSADNLVTQAGRAQQFGGPDTRCHRIQVRCRPYLTARTEDVVATRAEARRLRVTTASRFLQVTQ